MPDGPRYDDDFYAWTQYQAKVLRELRTDDNRFDREHVAEEIEDLGRSSRNAVRSQIGRIIEHFLKLAHSPAADPRLDWMESITEARDSLQNDITPALRHDAEAELENLYERARRRAALGLRRYGEASAASALPTICPYSLDDILRDDWYPDRIEARNDP